MKTRYISISLVALLLLASGCNKFLDKMPDQRTEADTPKKIAELLVGAYPNVDPMMIYEHRTDNVMDNGNNFQIPNNKMIQENYFWKDVTDTDWDAPERLWMSCYLAVAHANQALEAIEGLGNPLETKAAKGEALLCRAYAHFLLANTFCQPYNEKTAEQDLGIPYAEKPETEIGTKYQRGTVAEVYKKIANDIETGFPLLNDNAYAVPKYHFNIKAAAAFACRFYLFYGQYQKAIDYANKAIPANPTGVLRDLKSYQSLVQAREWRDRFISKDDPSNLMLVALRSKWGRNYTEQRYGNSEALVNAALYRSAGPWKGILEHFDLLFGRSGFPVKSQPKYNEIFEVTNETAQTGQPHVVQMAFTTDETLLCRAEAYTMLKQYEKAAQDLSYWYVVKGGQVKGVSDIVNFYTQRQQNEKEALEKGELAPWLQLVKPFHATFDIEPGNQEMMLQAVLHARRIETIFSGLRWLDIRRFGIEVVHNVTDKEPITLAPDDLRRVIQIPESVQKAGLQGNPKANNEK